MYNEYSKKKKPLDALSMAKYRQKYVKKISFSLLWKCTFRERKLFLFDLTFWTISCLNQTQLLSSPLKKSELLVKRNVFIHLNYFYQLFIYLFDN